MAFVPVCLPGLEISQYLIRGILEYFELVTLLSSVKDLCVGRGAHSEFRHFQNCLAFAFHWAARVSCVGTHGLRVS